MAPNRLRRNKNRNQTNSAIHILQHLIRRYCCWNCYQLGHNRHQCPFPRSISCSYCRRPGVLSTQCNCTNHTSHVRRAQFVDNVSHFEGTYERTVHVPNIEKNNIESQRENLIVFVDNQPSQNNENEESDVEPEEYLEINAEDESLEDI